MIFVTNALHLAKLEQVNIPEIIHSDEFGEKLDIFSGGLYSLYEGVDEEGVNSISFDAHIQSLDVLHIDLKPEFRVFVRTTLVVSFSVTVPAEVCLCVDAYEELRDHIKEGEDVSFTITDVGFDIVFSFGERRRDNTRDVKIHSVSGLSSEISEEGYDPVSGRFGTEWYREFLRSV
jgi:hypothetical protein